MSTPLQYLDRAMNTLRDLNLVPEKTEETPIVALLNQISDLDAEKTVAIARTLNQASLFNEVVREQVSAMALGERYDEITDSFNSIRDDAREMVDQVEDGKISAWERLQNIWMKVTRGDMSDRFEKIKRVYLDVAKDSKDQIGREQLILHAYQDFRGALKEAEVLAFEILKKAEGALAAKKAELEKAMQTVEHATGDDVAARARLELARDERMRDVQNEEKRYQIAKDLSDNLTVSYNTSDVIMARLQQTTNAKERVYQQAISFFGTNETVLTALSASFTGLHGLHESTQTLNAMKEGVSQEPGGSRGYRRQGAGGGAQSRLWADHPGRVCQAARRLGDHLSDALPGDHPGDAAVEHAERHRDSCGCGTGQGASRPPRRRGQGAAVDTAGGVVIGARANVRTRHYG